MNNGSHDAILLSVDFFQVSLIGFQFSFLFWVARMILKGGGRSNGNRSCGCEVTSVGTELILMMLC